MNIFSIASLASYNVFLSLAGLAGIGFLIGFHELGHFLFCKAFNIHTPSFSIGFGPRIFSKKIGDTVFSLSAIPLGGYVEIAGAAEPGQGEQKDAHANDDRSFTVKPFYQKLCVLLGGILFNFIFAYAAFIFLFTTGITQSPAFYPFNATSTIQHVSPDSAADKAGLKADDIILSINGIPTNQKGITAVEKIRTLADKDASLTIMRQQQEMTITAHITEKKSGIGELGVVFTTQETTTSSLGQAVCEGIAFTNYQIRNLFAMVKHIFSKGDLSQTGGPIMIISQTMQGAKAGFKIYLFLLALISINLAVLNLIPLPILDGGQILTYTVEAIFGRQIPVKIKEYIMIGCWVAFLGLFAYLSFKDISRLVEPYIKPIIDYFSK